MDTWIERTGYIANCLLFNLAINQWKQLETEIISQEADSDRLLLQTIETF